MGWCTISRKKHYVTLERPPSDVCQMAPYKRLIPPVPPCLTIPYLSDKLGAVEGAMGDAIVRHLRPVCLSDNEADVPHSHLLLPFFDIGPPHLDMPQQIKSAPEHWTRHHVIVTKDLL